MKLVALPVFCSLCAFGIDVPGIGVVVDPAGSLRTVQGVAGSFLLGPPAAFGILSAGCSEQLCIAKTDSKILSDAGETDAPPGPAIFAFDAGQAIVYFPETHSFARWHAARLDSLDWSVEGEILSVRLRGETAEIAVRRDGDIWVIRQDGSVVDWIATSAGPALLLTNCVLFATSDALVLRRADGTETQFALAAAESIAQMGPDYAAVRAGNATYALRIESGREQLFLLPAAAGDAP